MSGRPAADPAAHADEQRPGRFRRALARLTTSETELEARELRDDVRESGCMPIKECDERQSVTVTGVLRTVTLRPRAGIPALEAELYDGSGTIAVVWLGRRQIAGIEPGRAIVAHGRVSENAGARTIFNPRYELRPTGAE